MATNRSFISPHTCTNINTKTQRPVIAAGIRGLVVAGGSYTGPAMNPMIAFGWAVQSGAYKVRVCVCVCTREEKYAISLICFGVCVNLMNYCIFSTSFCLTLFSFFTSSFPSLLHRALTTTWSTGLPRRWAPCWPRCSLPSSKRPSWTIMRRRARTTRS